MLLQSSGGEFFSIFPSAVKGMVLSGTGVRLYIGVSSSNLSLISYKGHRAMFLLPMCGLSSLCSLVPPPLPSAHPGHASKDYTSALLLLLSLSLWCTPVDAEIESS